METLQEKLKCSKEDIAFLLDNYKHTAMLKNLMDIYGSDLQGEINANSLSFEERAKKSKNIYLLKKILAQKEELKLKKQETFQSELNCTMDDINYLLENYGHTKMLQYLMTIYGDDLQRVVTFKGISTNECKKKYNYVKYFKKILANRDNFKLETLQEKLMCKEEDISYLLEKYQGGAMLELLQSIYGEDLKNKINPALLPKNIYNRKCSYISYFKKVIQNNLTSFTLQEKLECSNSEFLIIKDYIKSNDNIYLLFSKVYGSDLEDRGNLTNLKKAEKRHYEYYLDILINYLYHRQKELEIFYNNYNDEVVYSAKISKDDMECLKRLIEMPLFSYTLESGDITKEELEIIYLKYGYVNGKCFSNEVIAEFLEIDVNKLNLIIKKVLLKYKYIYSNFMELEEGKELKR